MNSNNTPLSVLIIGASGKTGRALLKKLYFNPRKPKVHAFTRNPSELSGFGAFHSKIQGDARNPQDLERALCESEADVVVLSVGSGESTTTYIRTASAKALEQVLKKPQFQHVRVVVVSSQGAGDSSINIGFGLGKLVGFHCRHVLRDHSLRESVFDHGELHERTFTVRPTSIVDDQPAIKMIEFGDTAKRPSSKTDRSDLARYIVDKIYAGESSFGKIVNVTGVRK